MAAFGFGKAASIHTSCQRRELGLTHMPWVAQSPEHETDAVRQLFVMITGTATEQSVDRDDQVFKSEGPTPTPHAGAVSWVLASSAMKAGYRLAVAYRGYKVESVHSFPLNRVQALLSE